MKRIKIFATAIVIIFLIILTITQAVAETIYIYNGYSYTLLSDNYISICGWDNSSSELVIPAQLDGNYTKEIADIGLRNNTYITSLDMSKASYLTRIGNMAFKGCTGLNGEISIPARIIKIGMSPFQECTGITGLNYYADSVDVPIQCCYKCYSLNRVIISQGVSSIEKLAFAECPSLEYVRIPRSVTNINISAFKNSPNVVIYCYNESYAEQFAKDNNIEFEVLDPIKGDANFDKQVDVRDVTAIQKYKAGITSLSRTGIRAADVNGDGSVTVRDATLIQMRIAGIIDEF